jgi:hypothetical protein
MFELLEIFKYGQFTNRIFPIVINDTNFNEPITRIKYVKYWEHKISELDQAMRELNSQADLKGIREEIDLYTDIRRTFSELTHLLNDMNILTLEHHIAHNFADILHTISQVDVELPIDDSTRKEAQTNSNNKINTIPTFYFLLIAFAGLIIFVLVISYYMYNISLKNDIQNFYNVLILAWISSCAFLFGALSYYAKINHKKIIYFQFSAPIISLILIVTAGFYLKQLDKVIIGGQVVTLRKDSIQGLVEEPIRGVEVHIEGTKYIVHTISNGKFKINTNHYLGDSILLKTSHQEYEDQELGLKVDSDVEQVKITLTPIRK